MTNTQRIIIRFLQNASHQAAEIATAHPAHREFSFDEYMQAYEELQRMADERIHPTAQSITTSHIIPTVADALQSPWDYQLRITPHGFSLAHAHDDAVTTFISPADAKRIAHAMGQANAMVE